MISRPQATTDGPPVEAKARINSNARGDVDTLTNALDSLSLVPKSNQFGPIQTRGNSARRASRGLTHAAGMLSAVGPRVIAGERRKVRPFRWRPIKRLSLAGEDEGMDEAEHGPCRRFHEVVRCAVVGEGEALVSRVVQQCLRGPEGRAKGE